MNGNPGGEAGSLVCVCVGGLEREVLEIWDGGRVQRCDRPSPLGGGQQGGTSCPTGWRLQVRILDLGFSSSKQLLFPPEHFLLESSPGKGTPVSHLVVSAGL